eukprot:COSAG04_NODE_80_length_28110_cov_13.522847_5_plen_168_part_00
MILHKPKFCSLLPRVLSCFFAVFFCYPTICIVSFAATICTFVTEDDSVLDADDDIFCQAAQHRVMIAVSWIVIAAVALGIPTSFAWLLIRSARKYARETEANARDTARRLAKELDVDVSTASYVIRDVTIGSDYSFLMDACKLHSSLWHPCAHGMCVCADKPEYLFW